MRNNFLPAHSKSLTHNERGYEDKTPVRFSSFPVTSASMHTHVGRHESPNGKQKTRIYRNSEPIQGNGTHTTGETKTTQKERIGEQVDELQKLPQNNGKEK